MMRASRPDSVSGRIGCGARADNCSTIPSPSDRPVHGMRPYDHQFKAIAQLTVPGQDFPPYKGPSFSSSIEPVWISLPWRAKPQRPGDCGVTRPPREEGDGMGEHWNWVRTSWRLNVARRGTPLDGP